MAMLMLDASTGQEASRSVKVPRSASAFTVDTKINHSMVVDTGAQVTVCVVKLQGSLTNEDATDGVIIEPGLVIGSTAENVANTAFDYLIDGTTYTKAADAVGAAITAGLDGLSTTVTDYTIALNTYGGFCVYIDAAGTLTFAFPALAQSYASIALANAAIDGLPSKYGARIKIGKVIIQADGSEWVASTDDMTAASDCDTSSFISIGSSFIDMATKTFSATELANGRAMFSVIESPCDWVRIYLSSITGTGAVTSVLRIAEVA